MTTRLYYTDSLLTNFEATVTETGTHDGRPMAVLDRTAFYPTSGGQPHDLGRLGEAHVVDVVERDGDAAVLHLLDRPLRNGELVQGEVQRARRVDHIQQHSGQHVLSAAFLRAADAPTVSFHLGSDLSTIDIAATLETDAVRRAEDEANRVVWENRPVHVRFVSSDEASRLPLRKAPLRTGTLRIVEVEDFDVSACGGTHVTRTGEIGVIAVPSWERYKGGTRVSFACGGRALAQYRLLRDAMAAASKQLSIQPSELPAALERLQAESKQARLQARALSDQLAEYQAQALAREAEAIGGSQVVCELIDADAGTLKALAAAIVARSGYVAVLLSNTRPVLAVAAKSAQGGPDAAQLIRSLVNQFGGKGGGRPEMAQAGGLDGDPEAVRRAAQDWLSSGGAPPPSSSSSR